MKYVAEDGRIFDSELECKIYEKKLNLKEIEARNCIFLFTTELGFLERTANFETANFVLINEDIEYDLIDNYFGIYDCISDGLNQGKGVYKWSGDAEMWIKTQFIIEDYQDEINELNKKINEMTKIEEQIMNIVKEFTN